MPHTFPKRALAQITSSTARVSALANNCRASTLRSELKSPNLGSVVVITDLGDHSIKLNPILQQDPQLQLILTKASIPEGRRSLQGQTRWYLPSFYLTENGMEETNSGSLLDAHRLLLSSARANVTSTTNGA